MQEPEENSPNQRGHNRQQSDAPDLVMIEGEQARGADADDEPKNYAQGQQESISRQDEAAELDELGMHEDKTKPTHGAVQQRAGEPVLRRWDSPRLFMHSGLADTAHRADCSSRVPVQ